MDTFKYCPVCDDPMELHTETSGVVRSTATGNPCFVRKSTPPSSGAKSCPTCKNTRPAYDTCVDSYHSELAETSESQRRTMTTDFGDGPDNERHVIEYDLEPNLVRAKEVGRWNTLILELIRLGLDPDNAVKVKPLMEPVIDAAVAKARQEEHQISIRLVHKEMKAALEGWRTGADLAKWVRRRKNHYAEQLTNPRKDSHGA